MPPMRLGIRRDEHLVMAYDRAVGSPLIIRPARVQDVRQMARVHVRCWQETYRGIMPDAVLDDPGFPAARERMWTDVLTGKRYRQNRVAVAERDGELAGIAMSGPPEDATSAWTRQLYVLYVCWRPSSTPRSRPRCGSPIPTLARRRSTASTASLPTGRPGPGTGCGRSAWSAACSTTGRGRRGHAGVMGSCSSVTHLSGSSGHSRVSSRTCPVLR